MSKLIDSRVLRAPEDLAVNPTPPKRVLIVGSCLSEGFANRMKHLPVPCESDLFLLGQPIDVLPRPLEDYDFQIVQLALRFVLPDMAFAKLKDSDLAAHERLFDHAVGTMRQHLERAMLWNRDRGILTFVFSFLAPVQNPVGRLLPRYDLRNPVYFVERLNEQLAADLREYKNAYLFDINDMASYFGRRFVQDDVVTAMNHGAFISNYDFNHDSQRLEPSDKATDLFEERVWPFFQASWQELVSMYRTVRQADAVKLVVIDLDDTLWRGISAELDPEQFPTSEGWPKGFWEALAFLKRRGVLLAIVSKNDEQRVRSFWDKILRGQLKLDDFAVVQINWDPKPQNMAEVLAKVNLLPRNVVYIDDNPVERAAIKEAFPEIRVLGGSPITWRRILLWSPETQVAEITDESSKRTEMVRAQVVREGERKKLSREEFLATLEVKLNLFEVSSPEDAKFARVFELINKTNQFNTTGRRWTHEECVKAMQGGLRILAFDVADKFTEYGLVGVILLSEARIEQFVMSCRVLGLEVEIAAIAELCKRWHESGAVTASAAFVETEKNLPCRDLYSRSGFSKVEQGWQRDLRVTLPIPSHVTISVDLR
ncbi:HAD-IIIC family phosphatase [Bradyrhizobium sp. HKCCYLR20261]|uniref:HAD-IIIC family phosphatase n=1 Tax=Bradyrhizobium sp. HKCCYLR20261 TaxID=3420760 RepID=UPI003EBEF594